MELDPASAPADRRLTPRRDHERGLHRRRTINLTPAGFPPGSSSAVVTSTILNGVVYLNREDTVPVFRAKDAGVGFTRLDLYNSGNGGAQFPGSVRFHALRSTAGFLVGIGVTENGVHIPTKVRWSTIPTNFGVPPADWDIGGILNSGAASQGGENILAEMTGSLVDGLSLANSMVLYGTKESWLMDFVGGNDIFTFRRLFDSGVINTNCVVEYDGVHYVFGADDIYMHDGTGQKRSIASGRVRNHINLHLVRAEARKCFIVHNRTLNEIMFCYVSTDPDCAFTYTAGVDGCNRAAVYNIVGNCWYFYDLPYVTSASIGPSAAQASWNDETATWANVGGSWSSDDVQNSLLISSPGFYGMGPQVRSFALPDDANATGPIDALANGPVLIRKDKMDLDEVKGSNPYASLRGNKHISGIEIECIINPDASPINVRVGSSQHPSEQTTWGDFQTFDTEYSRIDCNEQGKFLAIEMRYADTKSFRLSGYDLDLNILGSK